MRKHLLDRLRLGNKNNLRFILYFSRLALSLRRSLSVLNVMDSSMKKNQTIDTYRLTSLEEPTDEMLSQLMKEAAEDAKRKNEEATARFFGQLRQDALKISLAW